MFSFRKSRNLMAIQRKLYKITAKDMQKKKEKIANANRVLRIYRR